MKIGNTVRCNKTEYSNTSLIPTFSILALIYGFLIHAEDIYEFLIAVFLASKKE